MEEVKGLPDKSELNGTAKIKMKKETTKLLIFIFASLIVITIIGKNVISQTTRSTGSSPNYFDCPNGINFILDGNSFNANFDSNTNPPGTFPRTGQIIANFPINGGNAGRITVMGNNRLNLNIGNDPGQVNLLHITDLAIEAGKVTITHGRFKITTISGTTAPVTGQSGEYGITIPGNPPIVISWRCI